MGTIRRRLLVVACVALVLVLLAVLPPLINLSQFQRRVAGKMSESLGRPVHLDHVTMSLLPVPELTLENFVVSEDPAFGAEPILRANVVHATLRFSSLWHRHVEFSSITLEEPSVNLVRLASGQWNVEGLFTQASQTNAAPTTAKAAAGRPQFPYIEATDARVNLKLGEEKTPFSLMGANFALWLADAQEWHFRIAARPVRTDTDASDTGEVHAEGTLRRSPMLRDAAVQMGAQWTHVPLGEASKIVMGHDAGWRGQGSASLRVEGTLEDASVLSEMHLVDLRRADFVPARPMEVDVRCESRATHVLSQFWGLRCQLPVDAAAVPERAQQALQGPAGSVTLTGDLGDVHDLKSADLRVQMAAIAPGYAMDWMRLFSQRVPSGLRASGSIDGAFSLTPKDGWSGEATCECPLILLMAKGAESTLPATFHATVEAGGVHVAMTPPAATTAAHGNTHALRGGNADAVAQETGYRIHLPTGNPPDFAPALAMRVPALFEGMPESCDAAECTVARGWLGGPQTWTIGVPQRRGTGRSARR